MDKTLEPAELILLSWSDWELWRDLRRCRRRDSLGGDRPATASPSTSHMPTLIDMCCSTTRFTAAADSANKESSFEVLFLRKRSGLNKYSGGTIRNPKLTF